MTNIPMPTAAESISDLSAAVASREGGDRVLRKITHLMEQLCRHRPGLKKHPRKAFRAAHRLLVSDHELPADTICA